MRRQFQLPDPGEGLTEAEIVAWKVAVGQQVEVNDVLLEVETAKSIVELPSPWAGTVTRLLADEGQSVVVGTPIVEIEDGQAAAETPSDGGQQTLVGYGPVGEAPAGRRPRSVPSPRSTITGDDGVRAKPPVRKLARDLGVDITQVAGTGIGGIVTRDDIQAAHAPGRRVPVKGVRRATADAVVHSATTHVHVTEWVEVDVTASLEFLDVLKSRPELEGLRPSITLLTAHACCVALRRHPDLNSSWSGEQIVLHDEVNLGLAAATPRGLLVPVIRGADRLGLAGLGAAMAQVVARARDGLLQPTEYTGGTFTLTNVGVFGVDGGTPIINGDQSAILCLGAIQRRPWVIGTGDDERIVPRSIATLSLSFDHRVIDGEQGSRFLRDVADILADPRLALIA